MRELPLVLPRGQSRAGVSPLLVLAQRWEQVLVGSACITALPRPQPSAGSPLLGEALEVPVGGRGSVLQVGRQLDFPLLLARGGLDSYRPVVVQRGRRLVLLGSERLHAASLFLLARVECGACSLPPSRLGGFVSVHRSEPAPQRPLPLPWHLPEL